MRMDRSYAAVTREVTARRNEGRNSVNVPVTSRGTMLAMSFCVCDVRRYGFTVGSVSQTMLALRNSGASVRSSGEKRGELTSKKDLTVSDRVVRRD